MADDAFKEPVLDDDAWNEGERFWREQVGRIEEALGQVGEWQRWEPRFYGDGITPMEREYLPICDGRSQRLDRAFHITQYPPDDHALSIGAWVDDYEHDPLWVESEFPRLPRSRLQIHLALSEQSAEIARSFLRLWMTPDTTVEEMRAFIAASIDSGEDSA